MTSGQPLSSPPHPSHHIPQKRWCGAKSHIKSGRIQEKRHGSMRVPAGRQCHPTRGIPQGMEGGGGAPAPATTWQAGCRRPRGQGAPRAWSHPPARRQSGTTSPRETHSQRAATPVHWSTLRARKKGVGGGGGGVQPIATWLVPARAARKIRLLLKSKIKQSKMKSSAPGPGPEP